MTHRGMAHLSSRWTSISMIYLVQTLLSYYYNDLLCQCNSQSLSSFNFVNSNHVAEAIQALKNLAPTCNQMFSVVFVRTMLYFLICFTGGFNIKRVMELISDFLESLYVAFIKGSDNFCQESFLRDKSQFIYVNVSWALILCISWMIRCFYRDSL